MLQLTLQFNESVLECMLISVLRFIRFISGGLISGCITVLLRQDAIKRFADMTYTEISLFRWCARFDPVIIIEQDIINKYVW
jgi:hypothetical protein